MDKYRPKRPTTLALFPQVPPAGSQDSINNNSLGKKDSWKDSHSSSPHITGDKTPPDSQPKQEDKVQHCTRRQAPKPPNGAPSRANRAAASFGTARSQRRGGRAVTATRERSLGDSRGKDGGTVGKEDRRGGRLCEESRGKDKDRNGHQRPREANGLRSREADGKGKVGAKGVNRGVGVKVKPNSLLSNQEVYLPAMVVPRTPVAPRIQDKTQDQGQNHDRTQDNPLILSRSSSEGGSNRMSLSSDTEGPPPGPLHPSLSHRTNPDISEEDGEGDPTPSVTFHNGPTPAITGEEETQMDCTKAEVDAGGGESGCNPQGGDEAAWTVPKSEASAGLNYDSVKYTLVVDEHAQLELVSLKECFHGYKEHNDDSDAETVYQSANEEEDPEYEEERKRKEEAREQEGRREEEKTRRDEELKRRKEEEVKRRKEDDVKRRREEEMKRRREVVARVCRQPKVMSTTTSEEEESNGGGGARAARTKKFLNLFPSSSSYSATGAASFGVFSCLLDGVERQQSHRAAYRFVPRHADELDLETDDPLLMLSQSEDLWCQGYNMRTGATGIFPAFYAVRVAKDGGQVHQDKDGWVEQFLVRFLGSVQVPIHQGNDMLCSAMQKVACNRRLAGQPPSACLLEVSVKGVKISVQDQCHSAHRGDQCFHFFQLKNISFCGCHPKHSKYFGIVTKHPDQQRFACHVMMSETSLHPLAESVRRAFQQYYKEHVGYSCPTEDIFIE